MKVSTSQFTAKTKEKPSKTSQFMRFLVTTCIIPVSVKDGKIVFKIFSLKTLVYWIGLGGWWTSTVVVWYMTGSLDTVLNVTTVFAYWLNFRVLTLRYFCMTFFIITECLDHWKYQEWGCYRTISGPLRVPFP